MLTSIRGRPRGTALGCASVHEWRLSGCLAEACIRRVNDDARVEHSTTGLGSRQRLQPEVLPIALIFIALGLRLSVFIASFWVSGSRLLVSCSYSGGFLGSVAFVWLLLVARRRLLLCSWFQGAAGVAAVGFGVVAAAKMATASGIDRYAAVFSWSGQAAVLAGVAFALGVVAEPIPRPIFRPMIAVLIGTGLGLAVVGNAASTSDIALWFSLAGIPIALAVAAAVTRFPQPSRQRDTAG